MPAPELLTHPPCAACLQQACGKDWEGRIAKRADSARRRGRQQSRLTLECGDRQELVVTGYTDPQGSRRGFGVLLVGKLRRGSSAIPALSGCAKTRVDSG